MSPLPQRHLGTEDLATLGAAELRAVIAHLNLPPVGALDDRSGPPLAAGENLHEIGPVLRSAVLERRHQHGLLAAPMDLLGLRGLDRQTLTSLALRLGDLSRYGQRVRPIWGGPDFEKTLFRTLESAERSIHLSTYVFGGEAGMRVARLLARKAAAGVAVRVLFCAAGIVVSGSPSGTGIVSRWSGARTSLLRDIYQRAGIVRFLRAAGVPFIDSAPVGRHWRRHELRKIGVTNRGSYERWARARGIPDDWLEEQELIDRECAFGFTNVDHRKMLLVDGCRALVGGQNIADSYVYAETLDAEMRVNVRRWHWHDCGATIEGGCVRELGRLFLQRWALSGGDLFDPDDRTLTASPTRAGEAVVTLQPSIPGMSRLPVSRNLPRLLAALCGAGVGPLLEGRHPIRERMIALPAQAQGEFLAEHCYPSDGELLERWAAAGRRLERSILLVPTVYDAPLLGRECSRRVLALDPAGVRVHGYRRAILHAKVCVADGFYVVIGSYNLTLRSARADLELEFFVQDSDFGAAVRAHLLEDLAESPLLEPAGLERLRALIPIPLVEGAARFLFF